MSGAWTPEDIKAYHVCQEMRDNENDTDKLEKLMEDAEEECYIKETITRNGLGIIYSIYRELTGDHAMLEKQTKVV